VEADDSLSDCVRFVLNGQERRLPRPDPTRTLLEYLREDCGLTGTKEGCAEGDCGACTVAVGRRGGDAVQWRAVNSCIRFLPTLDGCEIVTVEDLSAPDQPLHPVQQAMVDCHASQCGFCTPGFVMSLFALYLSTARADRDQVVDALSGNLCRCTGYRPIIDAGVAMFDAPAPDRWSRASAAGPAARTRLDALRRRDDEALSYPGFHAPRSLDALAQACVDAPDALLLGGGTDVGLWVTKLLRDLPPLVYTGEVAALHELRRDATGLWIGAAVTLTDAWPALVAACPALAEQAARFASPPVRNSGTLCGNLANGSPIGDSLPVLLALDATLELRCGAQSRRLPLGEFYLGYQRKDLRAGEFIVGVHVPALPATAMVASYKIAKRVDQDISAVSAAFRIDCTDGVITTARLAFGGLAATARRAIATEGALLGNRWDDTALQAAVTALSQDFTPLSDMRASAAYRLEVAGALLRRFHAETQASRPLRVTGGAQQIA
jgi:xanthine dehydrogenase small subunit